MDDHQKREGSEQGEGIPWVLPALVFLVGFIIVASFLLRDDTDGTNLLPDQKVEIDQSQDYSGQIKGDRYLGPLVSFRIPKGAVVTGNSDGYSEQISWKSGPASGELVVVPKIPGETLENIGQASGQPAEEIRAGGRPVLLSQGRLGQERIVQIETLVGDLKATLSSSAPDPQAARQIALEIAATMIPSQGRG
jgi:hypothetical protein